MKYVFTNIRNTLTKLKNGLVYKKILKNHHLKDLLFSKMILTRD